MTQATHDIIVAGHVISQSPVAGSPVGPLHPVDFVVSLGPEPVVVPDVVGLPEGEALGILADHDLAAGARGEARHATIAAGSVISQDPPVDTLLPPGSPVDYVVSLGPITVPSIVDLPEAAAASTVLAAGLTVGTITQATHATIAAGNVISQDPAAGTPVGPGHAVNYRREPRSRAGRGAQRRRPARGLGRRHVRPGRSGSRNADRRARCRRPGWERRQPGAGRRDPGRSRLDGGLRRECRSRRRPRSRCQQSRPRRRRRRRQR